MSSNAARLQQAIEDWNNGNLARYLTLYGDNAQLHGYAGVEPGLAGIRRFYEAFWTAFPGARISVEDMITEGDKVACRFVLLGVHRGAFQGIAATDRQVVLPGITVLRFAGGKCVERWSQADFLGLLHQLGVLPGEPLNKSP